jgi:hypothetical protein
MSKYTGVDSKNQLAGCLSQGCSDGLFAHGRIQRVNLQWTAVKGILVKGYGVASGPSQDYPYGALDRQRPHFKERGLDLDAYFNGTLNIDIRPVTFGLVKPEFTFRDVHWTDLHPPEHFSFSRCKVAYRDVEYEGWVYYPHPETKRRNFQNPSLLEVITYAVPRIQIGDEIQVLVNPERIGLHEARAAARRY